MSPDTHLTNDQIAGWLAGDRDNATEQHLAGCSACRAKVQGFLGKMTAARELTELKSAHDENYWAAQRMAIAEKIAAEPARRSRFLPFAVPALAAIVGVAVLFPREAQTPVKNDSVAQQRISDEELLAQVTSAIERDTPQALAPVDRLHAERDQILENRNTSTNTSAKRKSQ